MTRKTLYYPLLSSFFLFFLSNLSHAEIRQDQSKTLMSGTHSETVIEKRFLEFISEMNKRGKERKSNYEIFVRYIDDLGINRIANYLEAEDASCHGSAHGLGKLIGERVPQLPVAMQLCGDTCTYGCIHGVFRVYFANLGKDYHKSHKTSSSHQSKGLTADELARFGKDVNQACEQPSNIVTDFFRGNCAHGVGHAMGMLAPDVATATSYCEVFPSKSMQYYCETGIFMELAGKIKREIFSAGESRQARLQNAINYCGANSRTPSSCLRFLLPPNSNMDHIKEFAAACEKQLNHIRRGCFNAMGYFNRMFVADYPNLIQASCEFGNKTDQMACVSGISYMKKGQRFREVITYACTLLNDVVLSKSCSQQLDRYYYEIDNPLHNQLL